MMKKLFLMCFLFAFIVNTNAQEKLTDQMKTAKATSEKALKEKEAKAKAEKEAKTRLKKDGTPDKRYKTVTKAPLKKDGTPDKRYKVKENSASATGKANSAAGKAKAAANKTEAKTKKTIKERVSNEKAPKNNKDKVTGTYKGKKVYTGPRGGRYYINSNGNKTYISDDK